MTGWNANEEQLLCLVVLSDRVAQRLSERAGEAFFRAFIVRDLATGEVQMKFRWRYRNPDEGSWASVKQKPGASVDAAKAEFKDGILSVLRDAAGLMRAPFPAGAVTFHEPPDDGGDPERTIQWLQEQDLIHPPQHLSEQEARERGLIP